jgi:error-prone DNA polymerase
VPIFQEQVMQIAIVAAGFTPGEADQLRRAMAAWKRRGGLEPFREKLLDGMQARGYSSEFAERIYSQICGFGDYGFPESHAASFALLTYFSSWLKCHHPAAFCCGLLNSQPMGFYAPAQLIADVRRHGVRVLPVDVHASQVDCTLCPAPHKHPRGGDECGDDCGNDRNDKPAIRLGLRQVRGLAAEAARRLVAARCEADFIDSADLAERAGLDAKAMRVLAESGALKRLAGHRRKARWQALGARRQGDLLAGAVLQERQPQLGLPEVREDLVDDYASTGLSLDHHPIGLLRRRLGPRVVQARRLAALPDGRAVQAAGVVTHRQRPGTASGVVFLSLEDETGIINVIVWPRLLERFRAEVLQAQLLKVSGKLQNANGTQHIVAARFEALDAWLDGLAAESRDFC